jgi:flagellar basal body-associated protein FliL
MSKKVFIIAGALLGILGGAAAVFFLKPDLLPDVVRPQSSEGHHSSQTKKGEEKKKPEPEVAADLEVFVVNLAGSGPQRYLRMILSLGVKDEHEKEKIKEFSGPIRHAVIMYLTERKPDDLTEAQGKNKLRQDLQKHINHAIGHQVVSNVYFKEFLVQ